MTAYRPTTTSLSEMEPFHGQSFEQSDELVGPQDRKVELETLVVGSRLQRPSDYNAVSARKLLIELLGQARLAKHGIQDAHKSLQVLTVFPVLGGMAIWFEATLSTLAQHGKDAFLQNLIRKKNGRPLAESDFVRLTGDYFVQKSTANYYRQVLARHSQTQVQTISKQPASGVDKHGTDGIHEAETEEEFYSDDDEDEENRNGALPAQPVGPSAKALGKRPEALEHPQRPLIPLPRRILSRSKTQNGPASEVASTSSNLGPSTSSGNPGSSSSASEGPDAMLAGFEKMFSVAQTMGAREKARAAHAGLQQDLPAQQGTATGSKDVSGQLEVPPGELNGPVDPRLKEVKPGPALSETERAEDISHMTRGLATDDASTSSKTAASASVSKAASTFSPDPKAKFKFLMVPRRARASDRPEDAMDVCSPEEPDEDTVMATSMDDEMVFVDGLAVLAWEVHLALLMTGLYLWMRDYDGDIDMDGNYIV